jgi:hypothetical protein
LDQPSKTKRQFSQKMATIILIKFQQFMETFP